MKKQKNYQSRLIEFEAAKRRLEERELTPDEYEQEVRRLATAYGI